MKEKNHRGRKHIVCGSLLCLSILSTSVWAEEGVFEFNINDYAIEAYSGSGGEVIVPETLDGCPVEIISSSTFYGNASVTSMVFPETLLTLGDSNLYFMDYLESVTLPESLIAIDMYNFYCCPTITEVTIPAKVTFIGDYSFNSCDNLRTIRFEGAAPQVGIACFEYLPEDAVVYVPDDQIDAYVEALPAGMNIQPSGANAVLYDYTAAEELFEFDAATGTILSYLGFDVRVDIPASIGGVPVTAIGEDAFNTSRYMYYVTVPEGVTEIGDRAFESSWHLSWADLPSTLKTIGDDAFNSYHGSSIDLPHGLESIGTEAFEYASLSAGIYLPEGLKTIGDRAFCYSYAGEVYFPTTIEKIGEQAFLDSSVSYLCFEGKDLPEIAANAFEGLTIYDVDLNWKASYEQMVSAQAFFDGLGQPARVWRMQNPYVDYIYDGLDTYENGIMTGYTGTQSHVRPWDSYDEFDVTAIGDAVFKDNTTLKYFAVPYNDLFTTIGKETFAGSTVQTVDLFDSVTTIGENAFRDCTLLTEIVIPEKVTAIEAGTFAGCTALTELVIPESITSIGAEAFAGCTSLTELEIPASVTSIGAGAFSDCTGLERLILPGASEGIDVSALEGIAFEVLCISDQATDEQVDAWNVKLGAPWYDPIDRVSEYRTMTLMPYEETFAEDFFYDSEYERLDLYDGYELNLYLPREIDGIQMKMISAGVLDRAKNTFGEVTLPVKSVVIPETAVELVYGAFSDCENLEVVICYAPLETIPESTFANCPSLKTVVFVNGVRNIEMCAFTNCPSLETVYLGGYPTTIDETAFDADFDGIVTELPDIDALLEAVKAEPLPKPTEAPKTPLPELDVTQAGPYLGTWKAQSMEMEGESISLEELGMSYVLVLKEDGTADLMIEDDGEMMLWCVTDGVAYLGESLETASTAVINEAGALVLTEFGDNIIFVRSEGENAAIASNAAATATSATNETEASGVSADAYLEEKYVCTKFETAGTTLDAASLGAEYSVIFHEDGTLGFVMAGADVPGLKWEFKKVQTDTGEADAYTVVYFDGTELNFIPTESGLELDFFGSMILYFEL